MAACSHLCYLTSLFEKLAATNLLTQANFDHVLTNQAILSDFAVIIGWRTYSSVTLNQDLFDNIIGCCQEKTEHRENGRKALISLMNQAKGNCNINTSGQLGLFTTANSYASAYGGQSISKGQSN